MACSLKSYDVSPPGGFVYTQVSGVPHDFAPQPMMEALAQMVVKFRQNNNLPGANFNKALADISKQMCYRLNNDPTWCFCSEGDTVAIALGVTSPLVTPCAGCGGKVME